MHIFTPSTQNVVKSHSKKTLFKIVVLTLTTLIAISGYIIWRFSELPLITPLSSLSRFSFLQEPSFQKNSKIIYGFLPYWNVSKFNLQKELTHLGYFSLRIGGDGKLVTNGEGDDAASYSKLQSEQFLDISNQLLNQNGSVELVLTQFNSEDIHTFLGSTTAQQRLLESLDSVLLAYPFSGINVDIELVGSADPSLRNNMTAFLALLHSHLKTKYTNINLSVDVYASSANNSNLWDIAAISQYVDYIIIMAYDFHQRTSVQAGPVAPLFGGKQRWDSDINTHLKEFVEKVPPSKLLLGIPFYGYEWQTTSRDPQSHTFPNTGSTASIERVAELLTRKEELQVEEGWNEEALSPYLSYSIDGEIYVIYYENSRSLSYKLDYVNQLELGGIAICALGYEGRSRELWEVIQNKIIY